MTSSVSTVTFMVLHIMSLGETPEQPASCCSLRKLWWVSSASWWERQVDGLLTQSWPMPTQETREDCRSLQISPSPCWPGQRHSVITIIWVPQNHKLRKEETSASQSTYLLSLCCSLPPWPPAFTASRFPSSSALFFLLLSVRFINPLKHVVSRCGLQEPCPWLPALLQAGAELREARAPPACPPSPPQSPPEAALILAKPLLHPLA